MKKHGLFILAILVFFLAFGKERLVFPEKANTNYFVAKQANDNLTTPSCHSHSEFDLIGNQLSNAPQANKRSNSLIAYIVARSLKVVINVACTCRETGFNHFSHKAYLLYIYPSHNFW